MKTSTRILGLLFVFFAMASGPFIQAQSPFIPPTGMMDTLSDAPVGGVPGGGGVPAAPVGGGGAPAAPVGGGAAPPAGGAPIMAPGGQPMSPEMMQQMMMMGVVPPGGVMPGAAGTATPSPSPTPKHYPALVGQRIYDAVSYRKNKANPIILDDVHRTMISEEEAQSGLYSDDGKTQGDTGEPGDQVYSQILAPSTKDWMGGPSNFYMQRIVTMLQNAEQMDPLNFFGLEALTTEEFSRVPQTRAKVQEQMAKIASVDKDQFSGWAQTFLKDYRVEQGDRDSKFFPLYVPRYPEVPSDPPPPAPWKPYGHPDLATAGLAGQTGVGVQGMSPEMMQQMMMGGMPGGMPTPRTSFNPIQDAKSAAGIPPRPR